MRKYLFSMLTWCAGVSLFASPLSMNNVSPGGNWDETSMSWQPMQGYGSMALAYCIPTASSNDDTGITHVSFNTINNATSSAPAYSDHTSISTTVEAGSSHVLTVRVDTEGTWTVTARAWIDWNRDEVFDVATEQYDLGSVSNVQDGPTSLTPTIVIPNDASGSYRMRVRGAFGSGVPTPCGNANWSEAEDYTINVASTPPPPTGCLTALNGQWPGTTFTPACTGGIQTITAEGWTGEFSRVAVTTGTEYTFLVSDPTYFITIGDSTGTTVLTSGTGSVTWTSTVTGNVRFYAHFNSDCDWDDEIFLARMVKCGDPIEFDEPAFDCFQGDGGLSGLENGYGVNASAVYRVADDFVVEADTEFTLQQVIMNMYSSAAITNVTINVRADNAGVPGDVVNTVTMAPTSSSIFGTAFGLNGYRLVFDLATPFELTEGTYWLESTTSTAAYWEVTSLGNTGAPVHLSNTSGTSWVPDDSGLNYQAVFYVAGECNPVAPPVEGCLEADNGQWPSTTFVPSCNGAPETITSNGWTGEYSMVTVQSGEEYIFTVSDPSYFITIGNAAGDTILATGTGSVTWTSTVSGNIRFYAHFNSDCDWDDDTFLSRIIQCGEPPVEPEYGCDQEYTGVFDLANSVSADLGYTVANDFFVPGDSDAYVINSITALLLPFAGSNSDFLTFDVTIHSDNANTPGAVLDSFTGLTATSVTLYPELFAGFNTYEVMLTIPGGYELPVTAGTDTKYWISLSATSQTGTNIFWVGYPYTEGWQTSSNYQSEDGGSTWEQITYDGVGDHYESIWSIDATCEEIILDGCLDAENGQWPGTTFVPACLGVPQDITTIAWTGEYSMVQVTSGTEYIFSVSDPSYFITIGDEDGTTVLASGTGSVTWTANLNGNIRFYTHFNSDCDWDDVIFLSRTVQCGEVPPPPATCDDQEVLSNNLENGLFFGGDTNQSLAVDVIVGDTGFTVYGVDLNVFVDGNTDLSFNATFYEDAGGVPGTEFASTGAYVASYELVGNAFGFDVYAYTVGFTTPVDLDANTTYWMQIDSDGLAWEATSASFLGSGLVFNNTNVGVWTNDPTTELVYKLICSELGVSDMSSFDFTYYPNPVKDVLNIDAKKSIDNVSVYNMAGQQVMSKVSVSNGQVDVTSLTPGVYVFRVTLEGGQIETFKIIKK